MLTRNFACVGEDLVRTYVRMYLKKNYPIDLPDSSSVLLFFFTR